MKPKPSTDSAAKQLASFIAKFDPSIAKLVRASLPILRRRFSTATELVYDNYNALAIGWSPNGRTSEVIVSLAVFPRGVSLYFMQGAKLADPNRLLQGEGNQGRFIRLERPEQINEPQVAALLNAASEFGKTPLPTTGKRQLVIKSISKKQRPRRPSAVKPNKRSKKSA